MQFWKNWGYFELSIISFLLKLYAISIPILFYVFVQEFGETFDLEKFYEKVRILGFILYFIGIGPTLVILCLILYLLNMINKAFPLPLSFYVSTSLFPIPVVFSITLLLAATNNNLGTSTALWLTPIILFAIYWWLSIKCRNAAKIAYSKKVTREGF